MIEQIFTILSTALYENYWIALLASFGWGVLSILLSPCHLSSIPLVVGFISSQGKISLSRTFYISLIFSIGILITIAGIGIITASLGRLMGDVGAIGNYLVAVIFFLVGLYLLDIIKFDWNNAGLRQTKAKGLFAALILGSSFWNCTWSVYICLYSSCAWYCFSNCTNKFYFCGYFASGIWHWTLCGNCWCWYFIKKSSAILKLVRGIKSNIVDKKNLRSSGYFWRHIFNFYYNVKNANNIENQK